MKRQDRDKIMAHLPDWMQWRLPFDTGVYIYRRSFMEGRLSKVQMFEELAKCQTTRIAELEAELAELKAFHAKRNANDSI